MYVIFPIQVETALLVTVVVRCLLISTTEISI